MSAGLSVANRHVHVARGLAVAVATALGASGEALEGGTLFDIDGLGAEFVDVGTVVVLGIGDGGLKNLLDDHSGFFLGELERVERLINLLATNQVRNQAAFVDRQTDAPEDCTCF